MLFIVLEYTKPTTTTIEYTLLQNQQQQCQTQTNKKWLKRCADIEDLRENIYDHKVYMRYALDETP